MNSILSFIRSRRVIWLLVLWQLISVFLIAVGVWPQTLAWVNFGLLTAYIVYAKPIDSLLLFVVSIPFYIVLPNPYFDSLSMWRPLAGIVFTMTGLHVLLGQREYITKLFAIHKLIEIPQPDALKTALTRLISRFMWWDKYLFLFILVALLSTFVARFPGESLKQIIFLINAYLLYLVAIIVITTKEHMVAVIKYAVASTGIIVLLGYIQLAATLFTEQYYFWQYWAMFISQAYYGVDLANVLAYSNSWFSYTGSTPMLRMFSILPDSHSFGMIAALCMMLLVPLTYFYTSQSSWKEPKKMLTSTRYYLWSAIRFSGLAIIFSGTRGLWVGMLPALFVSVWLFSRKITSSVMKRIFWAFGLVILFFVLSPLINQALNSVRMSAMQESFLSRAASIYDIYETSNAGRLIIWRDSLLYAIGHPFGVGYGNFIVSLVEDIPEGTAFESAGDVKNLRYNVPQKFVTAHSLYLNILVELGLAGLLAFALFCFEILARIFAFLKKHREGANEYVGFVASFGLIFVWFLAYGLFDVTLFNDRVLLYLFVLLALCGVLLRRYDSIKEQQWIEGK